MATPLNELPAVDPHSGRLNVIVDTPKGSRNKYKFDEEHGQWRLTKVLPQGMFFPYDFGFLPSTRFNPAEYRSLDEVDRHRLDEIEHFFVSYNEMEGRHFKPLGRRGTERAQELLEEAIRNRECRSS